MVHMDSLPSTPVKNTLDQKGHLTRTQLYLITAILSICVIGLSGYLI